MPIQHCVTATVMFLNRKSSQTDPDQTSLRGVVISGSVLLAILEQSDNGLHCLNLCLHCNVAVHKGRT